jgi:hypothetical protein
MMERDCSSRLAENESGRGANRDGCVNVRRGGVDASGDAGRGAGCGASVGASRDANVGGCYGPSTDYQILDRLANTRDWLAA